MKLGSGVALISIIDGEEMLFSEHFACVHCEISIGEIAPRTFSFNSPHGACPACTGLGFKLEIDPDLIIPDRNLSITQGGIKPYQTQYWYFYRLEDVAREHGFSLNTPIKNLTKEHLNLMLYGENFERTKYRTRFGRSASTARAGKASSRVWSAFTAKPSRNIPGGNRALHGHQACLECQWQAA